MARIAGIAGASGIDATELLRSIGVSAAFCATYPVDVSLAAGPGAQCFDDGRWGVVFNGRIYNPEDLPPAPGDAERVAAGVMRFGIADVLARINGDFALAIFDKAAGRQYLARDRFGIKPLYYSRVGNNLAFASRSRALFAVPGVSRAVRPEYLAVVAAGHYRFFDIEPARSPYRKIDQLPPGHFLTWRQGTATVARYSNFDDREEFSEPIAERAAEYRALFRDAVARRLKHARRPAFTLSGGLDSSSVVTVAGALAGRKQAAISTIYADASYDESREIRDVIDAGIVEWHPVKIECPDLMSLVADMVRFHDEPVATVTWMTHCLLARAAQARGHDALFGGLGGDEQHAGEYDYFYYFFADLLVAGDHARLEQEIAAWIRNHDHPVFRKNTTVAHDMMTALTDSGTPGQCRPDRRLLGRYAQALDGGRDLLRSFQPILDRPFRSYLKCHTVHELFQTTMPCCLRASERNTDQVGLNDFFPFHDWRLLEFALRVPTGWKIRQGVTKAFLRSAMDGVLPERTRTRVVKTGWNAPSHRWFAEDAFDAVMDLIRSRRFIERGIYVAAEVERLAREHRDIVRGGIARDNHMMFLWQLINVELWLRSLEA